MVEPDERMSLELIGLTKMVVASYLWDHQRCRVGSRSKATYDYQLKVGAYSMILKVLMVYLRRLMTSLACLVAGMALDAQITYLVTY